MEQKILIVSDSHGRCHYFEQVYQQVKPVDLVIHLGDLEGDEDYIRTLVDCETVMVSGNNDYFSGLPRECMIDIGGYHVMLTHGHRYGVNYGTDTIKQVAREHGANIVMFGHTHRPCIDLKDSSIWAVNPGSITQPRQEGRIPSFLIMEIDRFGEAHFTLNFVKTKEQKFF